MNFFITHIKKNFYLFFLILLFSFLFFYHLDYNTLTSWDEGWYGSIAREMIRTGDFLNMVWNGKPYYDHPPMGFWLIAASYKIFGINEFATRFPSAILGLFSIILIYATGLKLFGKKIIGFTCALVLGTSVWYVLRVRSGNLDSIFVFFYILTVYLSIKSSANFKWFPAAMFSFGCLILSKTLIGISAILLILLINLQQIFRIKKNYLFFILGILTFLLVVYPWYSLHIAKYPSFIDYHFFHIGARSEESRSLFQLKPTLPLFYLHMGVTKWYYIWILSVAFLIISLKFLKKQVFFILFWNLIILYPFLTSSRTEIWHLIPVYLPLSLIIGLGIYELIFFLAEIAKKMSFVIINKQVLNIIYLLIFIVLASIQIKIFYSGIIPVSRYIPDDVDISKRVGKYNASIILDDDYLPLAVFYSGKNINQLSYMPDDIKTLVKLFQSYKGKFVVVTRNWAVGNLDSNKISYKLLEKNNSFSILTRP